MNDLEIHFSYASNQALPVLELGAADLCEISSAEGNGMLWKHFSAKGLEVVQMTSADQSLQIVWLIFPDGISDQWRIAAFYEKVFSTRYKWNHIELRNNRKKPYYSYTIKVSRNAWCGSKLEAESHRCVHSLQQIESGPVHAMMIGRIGAPFTVPSFKEIGIDAPGGVKFRVEDEAWILYVMKENRMMTGALKPVPWYSDFMALHFRHEVLEEIFEVQEAEIRRFGGS